MLEGSLLLRVTDQHSSVFAEAKYLSMDEIRAGFYLNVHYGANSGVEGGAALAIDFPSILEGQAGVNFAAYDRPEGLMWMIDGKLGDGGDGPISVVGGMYEDRGDFLPSIVVVLVRAQGVCLGSALL